MNVEQTPNQPIEPTVVNVPQPAFQFWEWKRILVLTFLLVEIPNIIYGLAWGFSFGNLRPEQFRFYAIETFLSQHVIPYPVIAVFVGLILKVLIVYVVLRILEQWIRRRKEISYRVNRKAFIAVLVVLLGLYVEAVLVHPLTEFIAREDGEISWNPFYRGKYLSKKEPVDISCYGDSAYFSECSLLRFIERPDVEMQIQKFTGMSYRVAVIQGSPLRMVMLETPSVYVGNEVVLGYDTPYDSNPDLDKTGDLRVTQSFDNPLMNASSVGTDAWELMGLQKPLQAPAIYIKFLGTNYQDMAAIHDLELEAAKAFTDLYR